MITTDISFNIRLPVEQVFDYVSRMENLAAWGEGISAVQQVKGRGPGVGAVYRCTIGPVLGMTGDYENMEYVPNGKLVFRLNNPMLSFEDTYTFEAVDGGTRLRIVDKLKLPFFLALAEGMAAPLIRGQIEKDRDNLIGILERTVPSPASQSA